MSIPKTTFCEMVIEVVRAFIDSKKSFTAHDITNEVRDQDWYLGKIDKDEAGTIFIRGKEVAVINHADVRAIVHLFFNDGHMTGYDRENPNGYWLYFPRTKDDLPETDSYDGAPIL